MIIQVAIIALLILILFFKETKIIKLKEQLEIRKSENRSLKIILADNDLIPKNFVK